MSIPDDFLLEALIASFRDLENPPIDLIKRMQSADVPTQTNLLMSLVVSEVAGNVHRLHIESEDSLPSAEQVVDEMHLSKERMKAIVPILVAAHDPVQERVLKVLKWARDIRRGKYESDGLIQDHT